MFGARYVGQAPSETKAGPAVIDTPRMIEFPDVSLSSPNLLGSQSSENEILSPFWFDETKYVDEFDLPELVLEPTGTVLETLPQITVTSILPHPKNPMAIINAKPYRIGDEIEDGWKLAGIVGDTRTVILVHRTGRRMVIEITKNP